MKNLKKNSRLEEIRKSIPREISLSIEKSHAIADRIFELLKEKGMDQVTLAKSLGKYESEVSKWLAGEHNFTLQSLFKIEAVLGEDVIRIPNRKTEKESGWVFYSFPLEKQKQVSTKEIIFDHLTPRSLFSKVSEPLFFHLSTFEDNSFKSQNFANEGNWKNKEEFEKTQTV